MKFEVSRGKDNMKNENKIKDFLANIKYKLKNYIKIITKITPKDSIEYNFYDGWDKRLNISNYERCKIEITFQMKRDKFLFQKEDIVEIIEVLDYNKRN